MFNRQAGPSAIHQLLFANIGFSLVLSPRPSLHHRQSLDNSTNLVNQAEQFAYLQAVEN